MWRGAVPASDISAVHFAWLQNFRRIVVRYERVAENFLGMLHPACSLILMRGL
jgi:transposase